MRLDVVTENPLESAAALAGLLPTGVVKVGWPFTLARTEPHMAGAHPARLARASSSVRGNPQAAVHAARRGAVARAMRAQRGLLARERTEEPGRAKK